MILLAITLLLVGVVLWIGYNQNQMMRQKTMRTLIWALPILELIRQVWLIQSGGYDLTEHLPIHLCGFMIFLMPLWWMTRSKFLENFTYYAGTFGALMALLFNYNHAPWFNIQTFQTFLVHGIIFCIPIFNVLYLGFRPQRKYFRTSVVCLFGLSALVYGINLVLGSNYFFLMAAVDNSPLALIESIVGYPWMLLVAAAGIVFIWYLMFIFFEKSQRNRMRYVVSSEYVERHVRIIR
ncbi:hypothetical protein AOC36_01735 [Erysipelothrix larvae]|uniref:TIGR02206 family membrane protein n=2 Tax=Erysipelothrix larvae TaxID=1514105 RepID=A0A0X8GYI1_9FIRM|nr:hypothetical protein AOC36_01735 [Erysipelothrix larvae]